MGAPALGRPAARPPPARGRLPSCAAVNPARSPAFQALHKTQCCARCSQGHAQKRAQTATAAQARQQTRQAQRRGDERGGGIPLLPLQQGAEERLLLSCQGPQGEASHNALCTQAALALHPGRTLQLEQRAAEQQLIMRCSLSISHLLRLQRQQRHKRGQHRRCQPRCGGARVRQHALQVAEQVSGRCSACCCNCCRCCCRRHLLIRWLAAPWLRDRVGARGKRGNLGRPASCWLVCQGGPWVEERRCNSQEVRVPRSGAPRSPAAGPRWRPPHALPCNAPRGESDHRADRWADGQVRKRAGRNITAVKNKEWQDARLPQPLA